MKRLKDLMNFSVASHNFLFGTAGVGGQGRSDSFSKVSMKSNLKNAKRGQWNRKWRTVSSRRKKDESSPHKHTGETHFLILNRTCLSLQWPERSWAASNVGGNTSRILALLTRGRKRWVMLQASSNLHCASQRTAGTSIMSAHSGKRKVNKRLIGLERKILIDDIQFYIRLHFEHSKLTNGHHLLQQIESNPVWKYLMTLSW